MPGLDGTGPLGRGPLTGWGMGRCRALGVAPVPPQVEQEAAPAAEEGKQVQPAQNAAGYVPLRGFPVVYGRGRGGIPRGCGRGSRIGRCWGFFR